VAKGGLNERTVGYY